MNVFLSWPLEVRMALLGLLGVLIGTQVNRGIYRLAWFQRAIGPWSRPHPEAPPRHGWERLPVVGWWFLRREAPLHGRGFWIRPLLLELAMGVGFAALYWYEIGQGALVPDRGTFVDPLLRAPWIFHVQLLSHLVLITLMVVATFIDLDEQTIPDAITIPGTVTGLLLASAWPQTRAIVSVPAALGTQGYQAEFLHVASGTGRPGMPDWPSWLDGAGGWILGLACFWAWCLAIIPWTWTLRHGWGRAVRYWLASVPRRAATRPIAVMAVSGGVAITGIWLLGGARWESLLSALLGLAVGGGVIWGVRIVGSAALQQEAMGFGDVTLMAMIGAFTGWQPTLIIFFLAPFSAILIAVAQYVFSRRHDIAFGPYLCLAALIWILQSDEIWLNYGLPIFSMGWFVPAIGIGGLLLMGGMLQFWRWIRDALFPYVPDEEDPRWNPVPPPDHASGEPDHPPSDGLPATSRGGDHPLRTRITLQPKDAPIPGTRSGGQRPPGSQLFRR